MDLGEIFSVLEGFDLKNFLPEMDTVLGQAEMIVRVAVLIAPLVLFVLGLWYLFLPPKEANHYVGFRTFWGMSSVAAWRFTQKIAGITWGALGLILFVVMLLVSGGFHGQEMMDMVWSGVTCILWELGLVLVSLLGINVAVIVFYDFNGKPRDFKKHK